MDAPCKHPHVHFTAGGLYLECCHPPCGRRWGALLPTFDLLDPMARGQGIPEGELRADLYAPAHVPHLGNKRP